jgi:ABC-type dipeptide/oligopeptide/nickel transport system ATPase component
MLLEVHNLTVHFGAVPAVRDVSFSISPGEVLGLVGESGSGKSVTSLAVMRLLPPQASVAGRISFAGDDLLLASEEKMRDLRGRQLSMIFQEPMTALNPVMRVGDQVAEAVLAHRDYRAPGSKRRGRNNEARERAVAALRDVQIPEPERRARDYPHQLSGGMRQRVMIAMAIVNRPQLLIADEPTTALDVTIQAQILELLAELRQKFGLAMLFISHDLAVVSRVASRVGVMFGGQIVELAALGDLFRAPAHPYTRGLLECVPTLASDRSRPLRTISDAARAANAAPLREIAPGHWART